MEDCRPMAVVVGTIESVSTLQAAAGLVRGRGL